MDYKKEYILKNPTLHLEHSKTKAKELLSIIPMNLKTKFKRILDIGCGAGLVTLLIAKELKPTYIEGLDISPAMIRKARELDKKKIVKWRIGNIFNYKTPAKLFDLIICADIIEHLEKDIEFVQKLRSIGNYILIKVPLEDSLINRLLKITELFDPWKDTEIRYGHLHHYNEKQLDEIFEKNGWKIIKSKFIAMPKRSSKKFELVRLAHLPIGLISKRQMVKIVGGFKLYLLKKN